MASRSRNASSQIARQASIVAIALSLIAHAGLLAGLAAVLTSSRQAITIRPKFFVAAVLSPEPQSPPLVMPLAQPSPLPAGTPLLSAAVDQPAYVPNPPPIEAPLVGGAVKPYSPPAAQRSLPFAPAAVTQPTDLPVGGGLAGRKAAARAQLVAERGGSPHSEAAVERGLTWLVQHQSADGGWRFNHQQGGCACRNAGQHESTTAATALALLPLLGAGHTPHEGRHQQAVERGLAYLRSRMQVTPAGGDLQEGTMYAQGLATIALCEAYALTAIGRREPPDGVAMPLADHAYRKVDASRSPADDALRADVQQALNFIVTSQNLAGGWRYFPQQPGDTTVLGWQWMALKSGRMAGLAVPDETFARAAEFLDKVQSDGGAAYGYQGPGCEPTPTAVGLLCRMYSGVRRSDVRIVGGCELLAAWGPKFDDMYFNYYATQVLHHAEAPAWTAWNERLRNHLIATQATRGHEAGSWHFADYHTSAGGRLCDTALCLMILEVYYRHLPLYGWKSVEF